MVIPSISRPFLVFSGTPGLAFTEFHPRRRLFFHDCGVRKFKRHFLHAN